MLRKSIFGIVIILLLVFRVNAQVPQYINYQGQLTQADGTPITAATSVEFRIYNTGSGGSTIWSQAHSITPDAKGIFSQLLGPIQYSIFDGGDKYLELKVDTEVLSPRKQLVSVGYSFRAYNADKVDGQELSSNDGSVNQSGDPISWFKIKDIPPGFADGTDDVGTAGGISQISVGTGMTVTSPTGPTTTIGLKMGSGNGINADMVDGQHASTFAASSHNHSGANITSGKISNARLNTGSGNGLDADMLDGNHASDFVTSTHNHLGQIWNMGNSSTNGLYMQGTIPWANSLIKTWNYGGGPGIYGINTGGGNGVRGQTNGTGIGVYGQCDHSGPGVAGRSSTGHGVEGYGDTGLYGDGVTHGGWALATGSDGIGLLGLANNGSNSMGVKGMSSNGYAGYFWGKVHVLTTLSKGAGSFKIDHPVDPANKYLYHSFVESPDMMNIYNGNVTLNANGEAIVKMPDWFNALNKDFRYQLTAIGGPGPNLYIADEISGNRFRIAGGSPGMKVSWQVTGIRNDAFAKAHRIPVEEEKSAKQRGRYLHPKEHGLAESMGIDYEETRRIEEKVQKMKEMREKTEIINLE